MLEALVAESGRPGSIRAGEPHVPSIRTASRKEGSQEVECGEVHGADLQHPCGGTHHGEIVAQGVLTG